MARVRSAALLGALAVVLAFAVARAETVTPSGRVTLLHRAAGAPIWRVPGLMQAFLAVGANKNARDENGQSPLHWEANWGRAAGVRSLLRAGADVDAKDKHVQTALHDAAFRGKP